MEPFTIGLFIWLSLPIVLAVLLLFMRSKHIDCIISLAKATADAENYREKYSPIISIEERVKELERSALEVSKKTQRIKDDYSEKRLILDRLKSQVAIYDEKLSFAELGVYEPHFDFSDSETYKKAIQMVRDRQKKLISSKGATECDTDWEVGGSASKGKTMINRQTRLTLRAFNNECEAAIANTRWNNVVAMEKRILNSAKQINAANSSLQLEITDYYVGLKLEELHLVHEYREKLKIEKDDRAELARAEREEKKLLIEAEKAEKEERKYQALLDKARGEVGIDASKIAELEAALQQAHEVGERARAMAEMTKSGFVYIISNIGSFGDGIVKIGLTRRLDPDDRVKELGDASVPFGFDTHAMIYSDEAPALEASLHRKFEERRVNMSNLRKEFFRVKLDEVEAAVVEIAPDASFFKDREAQEWHETMKKRKDRLIETASDVEEFPEQL